MIDSLNGYQAAMPEEKQLILHMHELLQYLNRQGATTFLTVAQHGLVGDMKAPVDVTYLADTVILLRYFEAPGGCAGRSRSSRSAPARTRTRSANIGSAADGITLGEPLTNFQGVLRGVPELIGRRRRRCERRGVNARPLRTRADPRAARPRRARSPRRCWPKRASRRSPAPTSTALVAELARRRRLRHRHRGSAAGADLRAAQRAGSTTSPNGRTCRSSC